ncbi:hypothetical protein CPB83DRAFT_892335 [Crepidotus variabilis]|uniref:FHA domain-containing protein n=1 Tax=Crepidotus variabilis TaxID=179855 RepID=A0A9P6JS95_9AGAR|nr:hypothetical protein CPB83DRAFT_892335 [Crepidotus variabilis]
MIEDEIVCLGSSLAVEGAYQRPILGERAQPLRLRHDHLIAIAGVILHVEKSAESPEFSLLFKRANTTVVHIGRRSGNEPDKRFEEDLTNAMFRCAVVSRKHAKIVFSDSGHAYIVDSSSHHGTHVRKAGESASKILKPETSTLLSDGDIITFGKAVGKGDEWVKPIVARVELYYGGTPTKASPLSSPTSEKSKSGRYGLTDSPSSSSDESSSDSDIEEIPAPSSSPSKPSSQPQGQNCLGLEVNDNQIQNHVSTAYSAFKRLLTPALRKLPSVSEIIGDRSSSSLLVTTEEPITLPAPVARRPNTGFPIGFDASQHDIFEMPYPSSSPIAMDIGTPSSSPNLIISRPLSVPHSQGRRSSYSPIYSPASEVREQSLDLPLPLSPDPCWSPASPSPPHLPIPPDASLPQTASIPPNLVVSPPPSQPQIVAQESSQILPPAPSTRNEVAELRQSLQNLQSTVTKLRFSRRKYKSRFNTNVSFISRKLSEIDDKFAEVDAEYNVLYDQVEGVAHDEIPDLSHQLEQLKDRVETMEWVRMCDDAGVKIVRRERSQPFEDREEVDANVKTLSELVDEMRKLKEDTELEISKQLADIKKMREQATQDIEKAKADILAQASAVASTSNQGVQTPVLTSLKRKRDDTDENEGQDHEMTGAVLCDVMEYCSSSNVEEPFLHEMPPPRKRARRVLSVITQTATAVTIGAVVTWSALAFS